jgi:hypothetical protein
MDGAVEMGGRRSWERELPAVEMGLLGREKGGGGE